MRLPGSRRPEEVDFLPPLDEFELRERHDAITVQAGLETEVVASQRLDRPEPRSLHGHLDASGFACRELLAQQGFEHLHHGAVALLETLHRGVQRFERAWHAQANQVPANPIVQYRHCVRELAWHERRRTLAGAEIGHTPSHMNCIVSNPVVYCGDFAHG